MKFLINIFICCVTLLAFFYGVQASASCQEAVAPRLPSPITAGENEMRLAHYEVKEYLTVQKAYLDCEKDGRLYDQAVDRMYELIDNYNDREARYRRRLQSNSLYTELV